MSLSNIFALTVISVVLTAPASAEPGGVGSPVAVRVGELVHVSSDLVGEPHVEPILAAHPKNPQRLLAASITFPGWVPGGGVANNTTHGFVSEDRGATWRRVPFVGCEGDPWVAFDSQGVAYLSCHDRRKFGDGRRTGIQVFRSPDGGREWQGPVAVPLGAGSSVDQPKMVVDLSGGSRAGAVYLTVGQWMPAPGLTKGVFGAVVAHSNDSARTFGEPVLVQHDNLDQQPFGAVVTSDGALVVAFMDYALTTTQRPFLLRHRRSWLARSVDGGASFSLPILLREQVEAELPWSIAIDHHGSTDRIYVALDGHWKRENEPPKASEPPSLAPLSMLAADGFEAEWSPPVAVSDGPLLSNAEIPAIAVNRSGTVGVAWYDTRHDPTGRCFDIYFAASTDGGRSFTPNQRVTPTTSCPLDHPEQASVARRWRFGGDYSGLAAAADGSFHLLWADSRAGVYQLWTTRVVVED